MRPLPATLLALVLLLAGCVGGDAPAADADPAEKVEAAAAARLPETPSPPPANATPAPPVQAPVPVLRAGESLPLAATCAAASACASLPFRLMDAGMLEVRVAWDGTKNAGARLEVEDPRGNVHEGERGFDATRVLLPRAAAGAYAARIVGEGITGGAISLHVKGAPRGNGSDLLPNLVTLVPAAVAIGRCDPWETAEQQAKTCLRLGNGIGNTGDGYLEVALAPQEGLTTLAGQGTFVQRILQREGPPREVKVGAADFHPTHAHYHYEGVAAFSLHPVDSTTGVRGEAVASHHKAGFCLLDIDEMGEADAEPEEREEARAEQACLVPGADGWTMGISRGWYDYYGSGLTDQYVEISGLPDGLYELVSTCNYEGTLVESDYADNSASVLVRLSEGEAEVLEERGFWRIPDHD